jgi:hypothetical protein
MDHYNDQKMQKEFDLGKLDGLNGVSRAGHSPHKHAYLSGHQDGDEQRQKQIKAKRIANMAKARAAKKE